MDDPWDSDEKRLLEMFPKLIFLGACIGILVFFAYFFTTNSVDTSFSEMNIFYNRLLYSTNAISFYDSEIGRSYLGKIDLNKLNTENLEATINYTHNYFFASKITLQGKEPVFYHKDLWNKLEPLAKAKVKGAGGADYMDRTIKVSYYENNTLKINNLKIEVIRARS